jgi:hypothetical protein
MLQAENQNMDPETEKQKNRRRRKVQGMFLGKQEPTMGSQCRCKMSVPSFVPPDGSCEKAICRRRVVLMVAIEHECARIDSVPVRGGRHDNMSHPFQRNDEAGIGRARSPSNRRKTESEAACSTPGRGPPRGRFRTRRSIWNQDLGNGEETRHSWAKRWSSSHASSSSNSISRSRQDHSRSSSSWTRSSSSWASKCS